MNEIFNKALLPMIKDAYEEKDGILGYHGPLNKPRTPFNSQCASGPCRLAGHPDLLEIGMPQEAKKTTSIPTPEITAENILNRSFLESSEFRVQNEALKVLTEMVWQPKQGLS
ncbi:hypothetical protein P7H25_14040 [Paenibacillus larvae]|nr:hypothetical protein [Paenibacillus larvae]MDT2256518.1 hypothetical protein [Paenibacillus larvae]